MLVSSSHGTMLSVSRQDDKCSMDTGGMGDRQPWESHVGGKLLLESSLRLCKMRRSRTAPLAF